MVPPSAPMSWTALSESSNAAETARSRSIVTTRVVVPVPSPDQPPNAIPGAGVAVRVTRVPASNVAVHPEPPAVEQSIPAGELVTAPVPIPVSVMVSVYVVAAGPEGAVVVVSARPNEERGGEDGGHGSCELPRSAHTPFSRAVNGRAPPRSRRGGAGRARSRGPGVPLIRIRRISRRK